MTDSVADAARSAAAVLAPDLGRNLPVEVEAALAARGGAQRPDRFVDPVSLGGLIVSIATLAWTVYNDHRNRMQEQKTQLDRTGQEPEAETVARQVRNALREKDTVLPPGAERITQVVVTEIIRQSRPPQELPSRHEAMIAGHRPVPLPRRPSLGAAPESGL